MENASKALLISGGALIAMLILSLVLLVTNNINSLQRAQADKTFQEQLSAFNMQFESYNKRIMYGTDVISVINKAVDNNKLVGLTNGQDQNARGYVNIVLDVAGKTYSTEVYRYDKSISNTRNQDAEDLTNSYNSNNISELANLLGETINYETIRPGYNEELGTWNGQVLRENQKFIDFFREEARDIKKYNVNVNGTLYDYYVYKALTAFKKDTFTCEEVTYDDSGRVHEMKFTRVVKAN